MFFLSVSSTPTSTSSFVSAVAAIIVAIFANEPQSRRVHNAMTDEVDISCTKWFSSRRVVTAAAPKYVNGKFTSTNLITTEWVGKIEEITESACRTLLVVCCVRNVFLGWVGSEMWTWLQASMRSFLTCSLSSGLHSITIKYESLFLSFNPVKRSRHCAYGRALWIQHKVCGGKYSLCQN